MMFPCEVTKSLHARISLTFSPGVCGIAGASIYASQIVSSFRMSSNINYEEEYGGFGGEMQGGMGMGGGMGGMPTWVIIFTHLIIY